ncbi:MAG TPA: twin-arginine translocation signal domain-containing protein, partial [Candidatus Binatia bacterium]|nr:twin-arginine translocation signal domain-containing protein [Candidatus Binatia bacterium]
MKTHAESCSCGGPIITRRDFLKTTVSSVAVAAAAGSTPLLQAASPGRKASQSETLVTTFYKSLTQEQRNAIAFPFDHALRNKVDNNWHITD